MLRGAGKLGARRPWAARAALPIALAAAVAAALPAAPACGPATTGRAETAAVAAARAGTAAAASAERAADSPPLQWPLDYPIRALSASFMEPRTGRYHAGIDLRTGGRTGIPVVAPERGWVSRLRASPTGYGKAIYLTTAGGRTYVFAHLSELADALQREMTAAQWGSGAYEQDLSFPSGRLPVQRGERIALSGDTGVGAPHLHFEVRDAQEVALNPLLNGFPVPDRTSPRVRRLRLVALAEDARIEGAARAVELAPGDSVEAAGRLGVQADLGDQTGPFGQLVMPLGVRLCLDGALAYELQQRACSFAMSIQLRTELDESAGGRRRQWLRLYKRDGNTLPYRHETVAGASIVLPADGRAHRLSVVAWDAAGNRDSVGVRILARPPVPAPAPDGRRGVPGESGDHAGRGVGAADVAGRRGWTLLISPQEDVLEVQAVAADAALVRTPPTTATPAGEAGPDRAQLRIEPAGAEAFSPPATLLRGGVGLVAAVEGRRLRSGPTHVVLLDRASGQPLVAATVMLGVAGKRFGALADAVAGWALRDSTGHALYEGGWLQLVAAPARLLLPSGARRIAPAVEIVGAGAMFAGSLEVSVRVPAVDARNPRAGLLLRGSDGQWTWLGASWKTGPAREARLCAPLEATGIVAALLDDEPPLLGRWQLAGKTLHSGGPAIASRTARSPQGVTLAPWPALELPLSDEGTGLAAAGIAATVDGKPFPARWDPEGRRLHFEFYRDPGRGAHVARVVATDRVGNQSQAELRFTLAPPR